MTTMSPPAAVLRRPSRRLTALAEAAPLLLLVGLFAAWLLSRLRPFAFSNDEGIYLMWTRLARQGFPLYTATWCDQPPLLVWALAGLFSLGGESVTLARAGVVAITCLGILGVAGVTWRALGRGTALAAALLLTLSPLVNWYGRAVMSDVPANSLLALAVLAALFADERRPWPALAAGLLTGASLMVKLVAVPILPVLLGALVLGRPWRPALRLAVLWGLGLLAAVALTLAWVDGRLALTQILGTLAEARKSSAWSLTANGPRLWEVLAEGEWGLLPPALLGLAVCLRRPSRARLTVAAWLALAALAIGFHTPLYNHHLTLALLPATALAGIGLAQLGTPGRWRLAAVAALAAALLALPTALQNALPETTDREGDSWTMLAELQAVTRPNDWIITDNSVLAFRAGLRQPPYLADTGGKRYSPDLLPIEAWVQQTAAWNPAAIVFTRSAQANLQPYLDWVDHTYRLTHRFSATRRLWTPEPGGPAVDLTPLALADGLGLQGYSLAQPSIQRGQTARLGLFWGADRPLAEDRQVFVHLLGPDGRLVAQDDGPPTRRLAPTSRWTPGQWVIDPRRLAVPANAPPGDYAVEVGLYRLGDGQRVAGPLRLPQRLHVE